MALYVLMCGLAHEGINAVIIAQPYSEAHSAHWQAIHFVCKPIGLGPELFILSPYIAKLRLNLQVHAV